MKFLKHIALFGLLLSCGWLSAVWGQQFRWELSVPAAKDSGYHAIVLPPIGTCKIKPDFSDLRLFEKGTENEIPFLLREGDKGGATNLYFDFERTEVERSKATEIVLKSECNHKFGKLKVQINTPGKYFRKVELLEENTRNGKAVFDIVTTGNFQREVETLLFSPQPHGNDLKIRIYNEDNKPLEIDSIWASYPEKTLVAELDPGKEYVVRFGNESIGFPKYDLRFFADEIKTDYLLIPEALPYQIFKEEPVKEVETVVEKEVDPPWYQSQTLIWIVLVVIVALLGVMTLKMFKKS